MISHKKIQVTVCTCKPFSHPFCAHNLCQGTNVLESPEYCVEIFLFAEQSVQYRHAHRNGDFPCLRPRVY